jgi:hypothetical protein
MASFLELCHKVNVRLHGLVLGRALELGPSIVLGLANHIQKPRPLAFHIALGRLLVEGVQLEQDLVAEALGQLPGFFRRLPEFAFECGHGGLPSQT